MSCLHFPLFFGFLQVRKLLLTKFFSTKNCFNFSRLLTQYRHQPLKLIPHTSASNANFRCLATTRYQKQSTESQTFCVVKKAICINVLVYFLRPYCLTVCFRFLAYFQSFFFCFFVHKKMLWMFAKKVF